MQVEVIRHRKQRRLQDEINLAESRRIADLYPIQWPDEFLNLGADDDFHGTCQPKSSSSGRCELTFQQSDFPALHIDGANSPDSEESVDLSSSRSRNKTTPALGPRKLHPASTGSMTRLLSLGSVALRQKQSDSEREASKTSFLLPPTMRSQCI